VSKVSRSVWRRSLRATGVAVAVASMVAVGTTAGAVNLELPSIVSESPAANYTPNIMNGRVNALLVMGSRVYVGGTFTTVQNAGSSTDISRPYLLAFNLATGVVDTNFTPNLPGEVEAIAPADDGQSIFVGGTFKNVGGNTAYRRLARLNGSTGAPISGFNPRPNKIVTALVNRNGRLFVSGGFTKIHGDTRSGMAIVDQTTGVPDPDFNVAFTNPHPGNFGTAKMIVWKFDVTPNGNTAIATGNFQTVGGASRDQIAMLNVTPGQQASVTSWQNDFFRYYADDGRAWCISIFPYYIRSIDISHDGSYFVASTTGGNRVGHPSCDSISRWEVKPNAGSGQTPTWVSSTGGDTPETVMITGTAIYVGGHEQWVNDPYNPTNCGVCTNPYPGGIRRMGFEAHDPLNGLPFSWNPGRNPRGKGVLAMTSTSNGFFFGTNTNKINGVIRRRIAFMPLAGGVQVPPSTPYSLAPKSSQFLTVDQSGSSGDILSYPNTTFTGPSAVATNIDWTNARGGFALNGNLYLGHANGTFTRQSFTGSSVGSASTIDLHGLDVAPDPMFTIPGTNIPIPSFSDQLSNMTGMFFDQGWLYYTVQGDPRLYRRGFTPESQVVGAPLLVGSTNGDVNWDWGSVRGMTMADGTLYLALANGNLYGVPWNHGDLSGASLGSPISTGGWDSNGFFVYSP
jgi:hypothetical protein